MSILSIRGRAGRATALVTAGCIAFPTAAFAYTTTFSFDSTLKGQTRSYSSGTRSISFTTKAYNASGSASTGGPNFTVKLYRTGITDSLVGSFSAPRNGNGGNSWNGQPSANYRYDFSKTIGDGVTLKSNNVNMR